MSNYVKAQPVIYYIKNECWNLTQVRLSDLRIFEPREPPNLPSIIGSKIFKLTILSPKGTNRPSFSDILQNSPVKIQILKVVFSGSDNAIFWKFNIELGEGMGSFKVEIQFCFFNITLEKKVKTKFWKARTAYVIYYIKNGSWFANQVSYRNLSTFEPRDPTNPSPISGSENIKLTILSPKGTNCPSFSDILQNIFFNSGISKKLCFQTFIMRYFESLLLN